tara:strand:- start:290 stop:922 length:633 start_codon:yes stop_codon:yes gene_type:complete
MINLGLYVIIDPYNLGGNNFEEICKKIIESNVDTIQLRNKFGDKKEYVNQALIIKNMCEQNNKTFIINDRVDEALEVMPQGIHVGRNDMQVKDCRKLFPKNFIIGNSNATYEECIISEKLSTSYIAVGSLFETKSKKDTIPSSLNVIKELKGTNFKKQIVGIGGITRDKVSKVLEAGADSICISSSITLSKDPGKEANKIKEIIENYAKK